MDWDKLKAFYAVADAGSFTHAANTLRLTQPSISRKISTLEDELRTPLFHRHARGLVLTEQGEILYETVEGIFSQLSDIEKSIKDSKHNEEGELIITASEMMAQSWLFNILPEFIKQYPKIQVSIIETDNILNLDKREADVAIRLFSPRQQELIQRKLHTIDLHLAASKKYLTKHGEPKTLEDLKNHTIIAYPRGIPAPFPEPNWHLERAGINIDNHDLKILSSAFAGTLSFVKAGCGMGTLNTYEIEKDDNLIPILPDIFHHTVDAYFVYAKGQRKSRKIKLLQSFLQSHMLN